MKNNDLPPEEKHPGFIGKTNYKRDEEKEADVRRKKVKREREINVNLSDNKVESVEKEVYDMKLFQEEEVEVEGETKELKLFKMFEDPAGFQGFLMEDGHIYRVNYSAPRSDIQGKFISESKVTEREMIQEIENHFEEFKLGRGWKPL